MLEFLWFFFVKHRISNEKMVKDEFYLYEEDKKFVKQDFNFSKKNDNFGLYEL